MQNRGMRGAIFFGGFAFTVVLFSAYPFLRKAFYEYRAQQLTNDEQAYRDVYGGAKSAAFSLALEDEDHVYEEALKNGDAIVLRNKYGKKSDQEDNDEDVKVVGEAREENSQNAYHEVENLHHLSFATPENNSDQANLQAQEKNQEQPEIKPFATQSDPVSIVRTPSPISARGGGGGEGAFCPLETTNLPLQSILLNEIAWSGSVQSPFNEWIELRNTLSEAVNLAGWRLQNKGGDIGVIFPSSLNIAAQEYFLLERTDDTSVPGATADFVYRGTLRDEEETLVLFDNACRLIDKGEANPAWPAGSTGSEKRSMERNDTLGWHTYQGAFANGIGGTPRSYNSRVTEAVNSPSPQTQNTQAADTKDIEPTTNASAAATTPIFYRKGDVTFSEIAWMGTAAFPNHEWIELKNNATTTIALEGWRIDKEDGSTLVGEKGDELSVSHVISPGGYFLLERNELATSVTADKVYDGALANGGEVLMLKDPAGNEIDRIDMASGWQAGKNEVNTDGDKPTMSNIGTLLLPSWVNGKPTPREMNKKFEESASAPLQIPSLVYSPLALVINEIAWMGSVQSPNHEWLELFNNTTSTVDLTGWILKAQDGTPTIALSGLLEAKGYFLLERTSDESIQEVNADNIYTGALNNTGEVLMLTDPGGNEIDRVSAWYAGNNTTKDTMQRVDTLKAGDIPSQWRSAPKTPKAKTPE